MELSVLRTDAATTAGADAAGAGTAAGLVGWNEDALAGWGFAAKACEMAGGRAGAATVTLVFLMARSSWVDKEFKSVMPVSCGSGDAALESDTV